MNWLQTNGVIYLPVVVKGATRVGGNVRRGLPANTTHSPNAGTMLYQRRTRWPNNVPALGERLLFATIVGKAQSCCIVCIGLLTKHATGLYVLPLENLPLNLPLES